MDLRPSFQAKAEDRANRQHEWLTKTLSRAVAKEGWEVQTVIFTGGTMGSVRLTNLNTTLQRWRSKRKNWPRSGKCMPEHCWRPTIQFCEHTTKHCTQVTPRKHSIDIMSHQMSLYRSNNSEAQDTGKATPEAIARAIRMRVNERPKFLKRRQGRLKSTNHWERNHSENGEDRSVPQLPSKHFWMKTI